MDEFLPFFQGVGSCEDAYNLTPGIQNVPTQIINSTKLPRFDYPVILGERFGASDVDVFSVPL